MVSTSVTIDHAGGENPAITREFLAFNLGLKEYGIDITKVQELRGYDSVTRVANSPDYIKGVVNLRGVIVPILDMRIRFDLGKPVYNQFTAVIITNIRDQAIGIVVDNVSDVINLSTEQIKPAPALHHGMYTDYLIGMGTIDTRKLILVDIDKLISGPEMDLIDKLAA